MEELCLTEVEESEIVLTIHDNPYINGLCEKCIHCYKPRRRIPLCLARTAKPSFEKCNKVKQCSLFYEMV